MANYDNDGRVDVVHNHLNDPAVVLRGEAPREGRHWLGVELRRKGHRCLVGTRVTREVGGRTLTFGLGDQATVGRLTIHWAWGEKEHYDGLAVDRYWRVTEGSGVKGTREEGRGRVETAMPRTARIERATNETQIELSLDLDGTGRSDCQTGVGFFDHMLTLLSRHSLIDLTVRARGDLHVEAHHTVEDVGLCLGKALAQALGDKAGTRRYGDATVPMDEALVTAAIDLSGRPFCAWRARVPLETLGTFSSQLAEEFFRAVSSAGAFALHVVLHHGRNTHHIVEAIFKAAARALRQAVEADPRSPGVPSTKGVL